MRATSLLRLAASRGLRQVAPKTAAGATPTSTRVLRDVEPATAEGTVNAASPLGRPRPDEANSEYIPHPRSWRRGDDVKLHVKTSLGEEDIVIQTAHGGMCLL